MTKIKVVNLDKLYNFVVDNFSIWNHLLPKKLFWLIKWIITLQLIIFATGQLTNINVSYEKWKNTKSSQSSISCYLNRSWMSHLWRA